MDIVDGIAFYIRNVKESHYTGNQIGYLLNNPNVLFFYEIGRTACDEDELDLAEKDVKGIEIKQNRFNKYITNFVEVDKDPDYSDEFAMKTVTIEGNELARKCNCKEFKLVDDPNDNDKLEKKFVDSSR